VVPNVSEVLAYRILRHDVEGAVEGAVGKDDAQLLVEQNHGPANGIDDAVRARVGASGAGKPRD
jgi:hypothetical protein